MSAETATDLDTRAYPACESEHYGRGVSPWGEEGDLGVIVWGHGRRALAALNAYERGLLGSGDWRWRERMDLEREEIRVVFREDCGCTSEQHAGHLAAETWPISVVWNHGATTRVTVRTKCGKRSVYADRRGMSWNAECKVCFRGGAS